MEEIKDSENTSKTSRADATTIPPDYLTVFSQPVPPFQYTVNSTPEKALTETEEVCDDNEFYDILDEHSIRLERDTPNCDITIAFQVYNSALYNHLQKVDEMNHEPEMAFTEMIFMYLDPIIRISIS
jgi:hypothetical protein